MDYSKTINLPQTNFSMKAGLVQNEPKQLEAWNAMNVYAKLRESRKGKPKYILHDGPPYANGDIHMGHALNKILKDIIVRYKVLRGFDVPFTPGWDCHGLPIEHRVVEALEKSKKLKDTSQAELRAKCREYAMEYVIRQRNEFKRLLCVGDWDNPYLTMSKEYEAATVETFAKLVEKGYIYRGLRPIHWSWAAETALAEAELEYKEHTSPSVYVKFPVTSAVDGLKGNVFAMIWTTTPWTLPANVACAFHEEYDYVAVRIEGDWHIMAKRLAEPVLQKRGFKFEEMEIVPLSLATIKTLEIRHPFINRASATVFADYVTLDAGTGIVHTAPGHGQEDFQTGARYNLLTLSPVDRKGRYTEELSEWGLDQFVGMNVFQANPLIVELLKEKNALYFTEEITHSYPHCWRTRKPVIFRATEQWFLQIDHKELRSRALKELPNIAWYPAWGEKRMENLLANRPDWCVSRQRAWGVPIPAVYCTTCDTTILTPEMANHVAHVVKEKGVDVWFTEDIHALIPANVKCPKCGGKEFNRGEDILDVWFDAGVSSFAVLEEKDDLSVPADLYIEGNDQYRGWFQSSMWPSVALRGSAPYKAVVTCGWMLDEQGRAQHKSLGNAIDPLKTVERYGADILRLLMIREDFKEDLRLGKTIIDSTADSYRKIRNTFRYLLGNVSDFNAENDAVPMAQLLPLDRYELSKLHSFLKAIEKALDAFDFHIYYQKLVSYCNAELSSVYFDILKDRLYCDGKTWESRRSAQTVLYAILEALTRAVSIALPYTAEEIYKAYRGENAPPIATEYWIEANDAYIDKALEEEYDALMRVRDEVLKALELARENGIIGKSLEAAVDIFPKDEKTKTLLERTKNALNETFIVSAVTIVDSIASDGVDGKYTMIRVTRANNEKCARCWSYKPTVGQDSEHPELCERCAKAVTEQ